MSQPAEKFPWRMGVVVLQNPNALIEELGDGFEAHKGTERRREVRTPLHVPIRYQCKGKRSDWDESQTVNISQSGVRFMTMQKDIKAGDWVDLMMKVPGITAVIELTGMVVWAKPTAQKGFTTECGVVFKGGKNR